MRRRISLILAAVVLTPLGLASTAAADNHDVQFAYSASAGGTEVRLLGGAVRSDLTAASGLSGVSYPAHASNTTLNVAVDGLLEVGVVETDIRAEQIGGTARITSEAQTAGLSLLDGLISADLVETVTTASRTGQTLDGGSKTTFVRLSVAGQEIPVSVSKNFGIGGHAYATRAEANVGQAVNVLSGPTALVGLPPHGTHGFPITNSTLAVTLPQLLSVGVVESTGKSTTLPVVADVQMSSQAARVDLLGGLITADAVRSSARVQKLASGVVVRTPSSELVNLRIAGLPISAKTPANTKIVLPLVATVTVNQQITTANGTTARAIHIVLGKPLLGLPAGAVIEVAVASAWVE